MTGTGTQADPFIVDNWPDFVTAVGTADAYIEFPAGGGVIDLNDIAPTGIPEISVSCKSIMGNDWIIQNLYCKKHRGFSTVRGKYVSIDKLHFLNFYFDDEGERIKFGTIFGNSEEERQGYYFNECKFSGIMNCTYSDSSTYKNNSLFAQDNYWMKCRVISCSINVRLNGHALLLSGSNYTHNDNRIEYCNIKVSGNSPRWTIDGDYRNCLISGDSVATAFDVIRGSANFNVINVDFSGADSFNCTGRSDAINLINTDLLPSGATIGTGFVGVTTEQLHDATYLASLGFPIGVD